VLEDCVNTHPPRDLPAVAGTPAGVRWRVFRTPVVRLRRPPATRIDPAGVAVDCHKPGHGISARGQPKIYSGERSWSVTDRDILFRGWPRWPVFRRPGSWSRQASWDRPASVSGDRAHEVCGRATQVDLRSAWATRVARKTRPCYTVCRDHSLTDQSPQVHATPSRCGKTLPRFGARVPLHLRSRVCVMAARSLPA
jgi:hypothetical protein